jgi:uncharacterized membrane protein YdjX (TVP38/TMEM64 family)
MKYLYKNNRWEIIMYRKNKTILIIITWGFIIFLLYINGLLVNDPNQINQIIIDNPIKMRILFILLSVIRIFTFTPQTIFIISGSIVFGIYESFVLSFISFLISQSLLYLIGVKIGNKLPKKTFSPKNDILIKLLKNHNYKILAIGIICPIFPSDLLTIIAANMGINYYKYLITIFISGIPIIMLYCFLGLNIKESFIIKSLIIVTISLMSYNVFLIWNKYHLNLKK